MVSVFWIGKVLLTFAFLLPMGIKDYRTSRIPNEWLLGWGVIRTLLLVVEIAAQPKDWAVFIFGSFGAGFFCILILECLPFGIHRGLAAGDKKLFAILGYTWGGRYLLNMLYYSLLLAAVVAIFECVRYKKGFHRRIPLSPYVVVGVSLTLVLFSYPQLHRFLL